MKNLRLGWERDRRENMQLILLPLNVLVCLFLAPPVVSFPEATGLRIREANAFVLVHRKWGFLVQFWVS